MSETKKAFWSGFWNSKIAQGLGVLILAYAGMFGKGQWDEAHKPKGFRERIAEEIGCHPDEVPAIVSKALKHAQRKVYIYIDEDGRPRYHGYDGKDYDVAFGTTGWPSYYDLAAHEWKLVFYGKKPPN